MRRTSVAGLTLAVVLAACSGDDGGGAAPTTFPDDRVAVEVPEDDLSTTVLPGLEGGEVAFADYAGRPVVVNFFASTCVPCVTEMPALEAVNRDLGGAVAFVGVATNDPVDDALALVERTGVTWDLARDGQGEFIAQVGGVVLPTTLLVDADGRIVETHVGEISEDELRDLLRDRLGVDAPR
jgi:thiol-disulfide isomerase/thioredoxin